MKKLLTLVAMAIVGFGTAFGQPPPPGGGTVDYQLTFTSGDYDSEVSWEIVPTLGGPALASAACGSFDPSATVTVTLNAGTSYTINAYDDWGDGWNGATYTLIELPCGLEVHSEMPSNGVGGDNALACGELDLESTYSFVAMETCPDCLDPFNGMASDVTGTSATISWSGTADFWGIEYMQDTSVIQIVPATNPIMLSGLTPMTQYSVIIAGMCGLTPTGADTVTFMTGIVNEDCMNAMPIPVADDTTIVMNGIAMNGPTIDCSDGAEDDAWLTFSGTGAPMSVYGSVQGPSTDFAMEIWEGCPEAGGTLVLCDDDGNDAPSTLMPLDQLCTEEGVDYYIRIWEYSTSTPGSVMGITVKEARPMITGFTNRSASGATVNFDAMNIGENQIIRYHEYGQSPAFSWRTLNPQATSGYMNNLEANTRYTVRVGTRCPGENAVYGDTATFWTRPMPCASPSWTIDSLVGGNIDLYWENTGADSYKVRYRMVGGSWTWVNTTNTWLTLSGLDFGVTYEWQVRGICNAGGNKPYGAVDTFSTPPARLAASVEESPITSFNLYPNPTNGLVTVDFASGVEENITFNVMDVSGKIVFSNTVAANEGSNRVIIDLSNLEAGVYLTTLSNANGVSERVRVILK